MTTKYTNVYLNDAYTIGGTYENDGPISKYIDKNYPKDMYFGENTWEQAEVKLQKECISELLKKNKLKDKDIDLLVAGDLQNQIAASDYMAKCFDIPFLGVYNACATSSEAMIIIANFIEGKIINNGIITTSSHNMVAEKQFRNPTEYGCPKHKTATFTVTGGVSLLLSNEKSKIRVESSTIGKVIDKGISDVNHMGAVMAPAAADTIYRHLKDMDRTVDDYDLILTGDLGIYGKDILINYMKEVYSLDISKKYNDCGTMIYDIDRQPVFAGGSGPACSALVNFGYIYKEMKKKKYKKVLIVPTGALFSPTMVFQKNSIPAIAHAVSLEVIE